MREGRDGIQGVELYSLTKLYKRTFGRYREDQERDALISSRLFALQFVTPAHLDIPSDVISDEGLISAMRELQKINAFKVHLSHHYHHSKVM